MTTIARSPEAFDSGPGLPSLLVVGKVRRAHGIRGAFAVEPLTDYPELMLGTGARLFAGDRDGNPMGDSPLEVVDGRPMNREWLVKLAEISDRDAADAWRGRYLLGEASRLPETGEDEVYVTSLVGMRVSVLGVGEVGHVRDVYEAPQGFILEVETDEGFPLVPWRPEIVDHVDEAARLIVLKPLEGLLS